MKKFKQFFKKTTSGILAAAMLLTMSVPSNVSYAAELDETQEIIEETTENVVEESSEEITSEEITEDALEEITEAILEEAEDETNDTVSEETETTTDESISEEITEEIIEETTEEIAEEEIAEEKIIGNVSETELFRIKNETGRKIVSFNIIESGQTSTSNMLTEDFEADEERALYFNYSADKDYDLVLKTSDGTEIIVYVFDIVDMSRNKEQTVSLRFSDDAELFYLSYASKNTLEDEKNNSDETEEEIKEDYPKLYLRMTEGGSVRFDSNTYFVKDNILYKNEIEFSRPDNLGYFEIPDELSAVKVVALSDNNGTVANFKVSSFNGIYFNTLSQSNSDDKDFVVENLNINKNTFVDISFIPGDVICKEDNLLNGASSKYALSAPSILGNGLIRNYPTKISSGSDPTPDVDDGQTTSGTFTINSPTYNIDTPVTFNVTLHGGLLNGLTLNTTCSTYGANNLYKGCTVDGNSYSAVASVSNGVVVWTITTGNESYPCTWLASENRYGHGYQKSKGYYRYTSPDDYIFLSMLKTPTGTDEKAAYIPDTTGITYDLVDNTAQHNKFIKFTLGSDGYPESISAYRTQFVVNSDKYFEYTGSKKIDGVLYAIIKCHNVDWSGSAFQFVETAANSNYILERDSNGNPVYHNVAAIQDGLAYIEHMTDDDIAYGAVQILKVDGLGNCVGGAEYTLYKNGVPYADASGASTKSTSSMNHNKGLITFYGLPAGTYTIKETKAPAGYALDKKEYTVTVKTDNAISDYAYVFDYNYYYSRATATSEHSDIESAWGTGKFGYFSHWFKYGCNEGRRGSSTFNAAAYLSRYKDIDNAFDTNIGAVKHYTRNGAKENRKTLTDSEYSALAINSVTGNNTSMAIVKSVDVKSAYVVVKKQTKSNCTELIENNSNYSLAGAKFKIYKNLACTQALTSNEYDFITDANGDTTEVNIGEYMPSSGSLVVYVKEIEASKGYQLNSTPERVVVTTANTEDNPATVTIDEIPIEDPAAIVVTKKDNEEDVNYKKLYLEDAVFEVKYYAAETEGQINDSTYRRHWYLKTKEDGIAKFESDWIVSSFNGNNSDAFYINLAGDPTFPLGYITIQEVQAPEGYILDDTITIQKVTPDMDETTRQNQSIKENDEMKQPFSFIKLADNGTTELKPLANAGFMACRVEDLERDENGNYIFDESKAIYLTDAEKELFTDTDGSATSIPLRYGTYMVKETTVPIGYQETQPFFVTVTEDKPNTPQAIRFITDRESHFYIRIVKYDAKTGRPIFNNGSTYKIYDLDADKYISFRYHNGSKFVNQSEFMTDDEGVLMLPEALAFGHYRVEEITAPEGYNIDSPNGIPLTIDENTAYESYHDDNDAFVVGIINVPVTDTEIYGRYNLVKTGEIREYDEVSDEFVITVIPLPDIKFGIYADEDIYTKDGTNTLIYAKGELAFTITTDEEGKAFQNNIPLGKYVVKELNTPDDFIKADDESIEFKLSDKKQDANGKYFVEQSSEILNKAYYPNVRTTAKDKATGSHTGVIAKQVTTIDTVECTNLIIGKEYTVKGKLYNTETGEVFLDNGKEVVSEKTFKADKKDMTVELEFTYNSTSLIGETIVVFEDLYDEHIKLATHSDLNDKEQQIHYPSIGTTFKNAVDGGKAVNPKTSVTLNDTVKIENVAVGDRFVLRGIIYDKSTGDKLIIKDSEISAYNIFMSDNENMSVDVIFTFDASSLAEKDIVCYEYLYLIDENGDEILIAEHTDINDAGQTIKFTPATPPTPKTGDRGFADILTVLIFSFMAMIVLILGKKKILK